jgi:hypothetical protein
MLVKIKMMAIYILLYTEPIAAVANCLFQRAEFKMQLKELKYF